MDTMLKVITPSGHTFEIFADGTAAGFPPGSLVINNWIAAHNLEAGLRIQAQNQCLIPDKDAPYVCP